MKRNVLLLLFSVFYFFVSSGQIVKLILNNPYPRVGHVVSISFNILTDSSENTKQTQNTSSLLETQNDAILGNGQINLRRTFTTAGDCFIGPFSFTVNGKTISSDRITLTVGPKLPDVSEGLWLNQIKFEKKEYVVIEQRIDKEKVMSLKNFNLSDAFVDLKDKILDVDNIVSFRQAFSSYPSEPYDECFLESGICSKYSYYQILVYEIIKGINFNKGYTLNKKSFSNFPSSVEFNDFTIK